MNKKPTKIASGFAALKDFVEKSEVLDDSKPKKVDTQPVPVNNEEDRKEANDKKEKVRTKATTKKVDENPDRGDVERRFSFESLVSEKYNYSDFKTIFCNDWSGIEPEDLGVIRIDKKFLKVLSMVGNKQGVTKQSIINNILYEWLWSNRKNLEKLYKEGDLLF